MSSVFPKYFYKIPDLYKNVQNCTKTYENILFCFQGISGLFRVYFPTPRYEMGKYPSSPSPSPSPSSLSPSPISSPWKALFCPLLGLSFHCYGYYTPAVLSWPYKAIFWLVWVDQFSPSFPLSIGGAFPSPAGFPGDIAPALYFALEGP